jgi:adenylate cyclase
MSRLSPALLLASQLGEYEAVKSRHDHIQPEHLMIAVLSLDKVFDPAVQWQFQISDDTLAQVRSEWEPVRAILTEHGAEPSRVRRAVRRSLAQQTALSSSKVAIPEPAPETAQVLSRASRIAEVMRSERVRIEHFLTALLGEPIPRVQDLLRALSLDAASLRPALLPLETATRAPTAENRGTPQHDEVAAVVPIGPSQISSPAPTTADAPQEPVPSASPSSVAEAEGPQEQQEVAMVRTRVVESLDAGRPMAQSLKGLAQRLACLWEVPGQLEKQTRLEPFLHRFLRNVMETMPDATRGAVLMRGSGDDDFLLKAHYPVGEPAVNLTAARQAIESKQAFISRSHSPEADAAFGIYAPLTWKGEVLGVLCVDGALSQSSFDADDLALMITCAQHAAMAIVNHRLQDDVRRNGALVERLLTNFSPKIRQRLLERARRGRLQLGGERSEVTILFSDIRNFTSITADLETEDIMDLLNECFSVSAESIFKFGGTIDKFVGDAILAVFGSPDPDPHQHLNSLRAALSMQEAVAQLNRTRAARGRVLCQIGIGVHCGEVLHGFVGAAERIEFTVIGDAVNKASRYCAAAPAGDVLISSELYQRVWRNVEATQTTIPTKHEGPLSAYRIRGLRIELSGKEKTA